MTGPRLWTRSPTQGRAALWHNLKPATVTSPNLSPMHGGIAGAFPLAMPAEAAVTDFRATELKRAGGITTTQASLSAGFDWPG